MIGFRRLFKVVAWPASALALLTACDEGTGGVAPVISDTMPSAASPAPTEAPPSSVERTKALFKPIGADERGLGELTVLGPIGGVGNGRTFQFAGGTILELELMGSVDVAKPIGAQPAAAVLGLTESALNNGGNPSVYLLKVISEQPPEGSARLCGETSTPFAVVRQPETASDNTLTLVMLAGALDDGNTQSCYRAEYVAG